MCTSLFTLEALYKKETPSMHESTRINPKKDKSARRREQKGWKPLKPTLRIVHLPIERKIADGRTRIDIRTKLEIL